MCLVSVNNETNSDLKDGHKAGKLKKRINADAHGHTNCDSIYICNSVVKAKVNVKR